MASSSSSRTTMMMSSYSCEMRPKMLKDFLSDDPSCSSSKNNNGTFKKTPSGILLRTGSKSASISISAIHKASEAVIKAIKFFPFAAKRFPRAVAISHAPSLLLRSISRKKSKSSVLEEQEQSTPKIKDILRWKSFRDVVEELSTSWLEDDFSPDDLNDYQQNCCFSFDENEQQSPVCVLNDSPFRDYDHHHEEDEEEPILFFTMERRKNKVMEAIAEFEAIAKQEDYNKSETNWETEVEEKAWQLLEQVKASSSSLKSSNESNDFVLLDFFVDELTAEELPETEMVKMAEAWVKKVSYRGEFDSGLLDNRKACLLDMETGPMGWRKSPYYEEQQELTIDLEDQVLDDLLDELWKEL